MAKETKPAKRKTLNAKPVKKGQGASEYLMALVVVLVIAVIVIALLGGFTPFGTMSLMQQSEVYWQSASPFSIENAHVVSQNSS